ncbi:MAG: mannitol dehydrogenase family protein [Pseudomonadota bacterium]
MTATDAPRIVHLGLGAFFRAHTAAYISDAAAGYGVIGVSMTSDRVRGLLAPRGNRYTAVETSADGLKPRDIDILTDVLVAPRDPEAVLDAMAHASTQIVSLTITEKGYCRSANGHGIDLDNADVRHDIEYPLPRTAPGFIVHALGRRRQAGLRPFTVMSLDNLPGNGQVLQGVTRDLAAKIDPTLADWIDQHCLFPSTMVDRIVPATTPEMIARLKDDAGIDDPGAVFHEPFRQWVIEDSFVDGKRPDFAAAGAIMVHDVEPFERMKLRMLNGTHSALAYVGRICGFETVSQAVSDPKMRSFIEALWADEIIPTVQPPEGVNLATYAADLLARYKNPEIHHGLEQIASDGSQKLPQRILDPLFENSQNGRPYRRLLMVLGAWMAFLHAKQSTEAISDPLAAELGAAVSASNDAEALVTNLLNLRAVFGNYSVADIAPELTQIVDTFLSATPP